MEHNKNCIQKWPEKNKISGWPKIKNPTKIETIINSFVQIS